MSSKEVRLLWAVLVIAVILIAVFIFRMEISYTGSFIGLTTAPEVVQMKVWDFANSAEYTYDADKVNLSGGEAKLIPGVNTQTTTTTATTEATISSGIVYEEDDGEIESEDVTSKVTSLEQGHVQLKDDKKVLGVTFTKTLKNSDILSLYLLNGSVGKLYVCTSSAGCSSAEQGELAVSSGEEGWRNISLSNVNSPQATFYLDSPARNPPEKIKIDLVKGYNITTSTETTIITTYPSSAALETIDLQPTDLKRWDSFAKTETLNGQQLDYAYSTDSGSSWGTLPANGDLNAVTAAKLRLKATLTSDGSGTPVLKSMKLNYTTQQPCTENWKTNYSACLSTDIQLKWYIDQNDCGTTTILPADNGTSVPCDYCTPVWNPQNTSCTPGDALTTWYSDAQNCYAQTGSAGDLATKPANLSHACDYCAAHNCTESFQTILNASTILNATTWYIDAREKTKTWLEITAPNAEGTVTIIEYNHSRVNSTPPAIDLKKQVEINSSVSNVTSVRIILYYTNEELQRTGIDENTLKIHYHNETSGQWQELPSIVNATGNYVYVVVDHLSLYGLFGDGIQEEGSSASSDSSSSSSGGSDGGGGTGKGEETKITASTETAAGAITSPEQTKEIIQPVLEIPAAAIALTQETTAEQPCNYVVEVTLPDQVSFLENNIYEGEIENKGDCTISRLELQLSPELRPILELPAAEFEAIKPGDKHSFTLIRKQSRREKMFSVITTLATAEEVGTEEVAGLLLLNSRAEDKTVYARELPLRVEIPAPLRITSPPVIKMGIALVLLILVIAAVHWDKEERERLKRYRQNRDRKKFRDNR